jgi:ABC-type transport system substrate-binding protein
MKKRTIIVIGLGILLVNLFSMGGPIENISYLETGSIETPLASSGELRPLYYTTANLGANFDPHNVWDSAGIDVINQIWEGLFAYDLSSPDLEIIPKLAASMGVWNATGTGYTVDLRKSVYFHDGSPLNAWSVQWSFDRLRNLIEIGDCPFSALYRPLENLYPSTPDVIKGVEVLSTYQVKFALNYPFAPFEPLLCFAGSSILSIASTPFDRVLETVADSLIGTGPFRFIDYETNRIIFKAYEGYWQGPADIKEMHWVKVWNNAERQNLFLDGGMDMVNGWTEDYYDAYVTDPTVVLSDPTPTLTTYYLAMNNKQIPKFIRQAINYAVDYDYIIQVLLPTDAVQAFSPIPEGVPYYDASFNNPYFDITSARQILVDNGLSHGLTMVSTDQDWIDEALSAPIAALNYSYYEGNLFRQDVGYNLQATLELIGIDLLLLPLVWGDYVALYSNYDAISLFLSGWGADYIDASNFINPLFSNTSYQNMAQVNDPVLQIAMEEALATTNQGERQTLYSQIQQYIVEDLMPWVILYQPIAQLVHRDAITNFPYNPLNLLNFYSCSFDPDSDFDGLLDRDEFMLHTDPYNSDTDGDGLTDWEEVNQYGTDPLLLDSDGDLLSDWEEIVMFGTDPLLFDTDGDGLSDREELIVYGSDPFESDTDGDQLDDLAEISYHTDLEYWDSDGDGLSDGDEVYIYGTDPTNEDTDHDGLFDGDEIGTYQTDPLLWDSDNDNLGDAFELLIGTDPLNDDSDLDGYYDGTEVEFGTDPLDAGSYPGQTTTTDTGTGTDSETDDDGDGEFKILGYPVSFLALFLFSAVFVVILRKQPRR